MPRPRRPSEVLPQIRPEEVRPDPGRAQAGFGVAVGFPLLSRRSSGSPCVSPARTSTGCAWPWPMPGKGSGAVEPNPMVGAVVVRDGRLVGVGHHERFGGPHAEVIALRQAGEAARGATLYVTLEPCCHFGKTPPCTDAILAAGIARVVAAVRDPFPAVDGGGLAILERGGSARSRSAARPRPRGRSMRPTGSG